jgi:recombination protein RecR
MKSFDKLIGCLKRLPGIGPKQAERMAVYLLRAPIAEADTLANAVRELKAKVHPCVVCLNYTESQRCSICEDPGRDRSVLCVVEQPADVTALERSRGHRGLYHVLHGQLSPLHGQGPESIRMAELVERVRSSAGDIREIILAMDPDTEGEATALYIASVLKSFPVRMTRIAQGVPMGGDLDYLDEQTLSAALRSRREV